MVEIQFQTNQIDTWKSGCEGCQDPCCSEVSFWIDAQFIHLFGNADVITEGPLDQVKVAYDGDCEHFVGGRCDIYDHEARPQQCWEYPYGPDEEDPDMPPTSCSLEIKLPLRVR